MPECRLSLTAVSLGPNGDDGRAAPPRPFPTGPCSPSAMEHANLPSLVAVLYQLTGDRRWLADPYRPTRSRGMEDNDPGGFAPEVQAEIRAAAVDAVLAWAGGRPPAVPAPTGDALLELIDLAVGEPVPHGVRADGGRGHGLRPSPDAPAAPPSDFRVVVIGAGVSGMLAAIRLAEAGIDHVVLEKNADVGGTWLENAYPGAGVDTPSHLYSYSFAPRRWSTHFGKRDEVLRPTCATSPTPTTCASDIRFDTEVAGAAYARPALDRDRRRRARPLTADAVITAVGQLNRPKIPALPGMDASAGRVVPLRALARGPRRHREAGGASSAPGRARCRSCPRSPSGRPRHGLPALAAVGRARTTCTSPPSTTPRALLHGARAVLPALVPRAARRGTRRPGPRHAAEGPGVGARRPVGERRQRRAPPGASPGTSRASWAAAPTWSRRRCRTTRRSASGCCWTTAGTRRSGATTSTWSPTPVAAITPTGRAGAATAPRSRRDVVVLCTGFEAQKLLWPLEVTRPARTHDRRRLGARRRRRAPGHHRERLPEPVPDRRAGHRARPRRQLHHDRRVPGALHRRGAGRR